MLMFSFNNPILLRGFYIWSLMNNLSRIIKNLHKNLNTIIRSYRFDFGIKLSFNPRNKVFQFCLCFSSINHRKNPYKTSVIINYCKEIFMAIKRESSTRTPNINMNKRKRSRSMWITMWKRKLSLLWFMTSITNKLFIIWQYRITLF